MKKKVETKTDSIGGEEEIRVGTIRGMNDAYRNHLELELRTLKSVTRDEEKLERLLKIKRRQKEEAIHMEDTRRLVTEIEMLKVVLYLVISRE